MAIIKQAKTINEPIHLFVDVNLVLLRFKRSIFLIRTIRKCADAAKSSKVTLKTVFLMFEVFASMCPKMTRKNYKLLPYRDSLVKLAQLSLTEIVTNILCTRVS